jgi:hypothetical protein
VDPIAFNRLAVPGRAPGVVAALRREAQALQNFRGQMWDRLGYNEHAANPSKVPLGSRIADVGRAATYSLRAMGDAITDRQPPKAKAAFQKIMDMLRPAEGLRSEAEARGRIIGATYEQAVREASRVNTGKLGNILAHYGLADMTDREGLMLRHVLTEGDPNSFVPEEGKPAVPVPRNIVEASSKIRYLLDQEWERNAAAGVKVGYARNGYFPRIYDDVKIAGDEHGFKDAAAKLHAFMFEKEVGGDPAKLLAAHDRMPEDVRDRLPANVQDAVRDLRKNLKAQEVERAAIAADPTHPTAKLDQLTAEAADLHDQLHDPLRDEFASNAANTWWTRINVGDPTDFDTRGPSAAYLRTRSLPPEADTIMREYMVNDPTLALPRYFHQSARKVAYAERFGAPTESAPGGAGLDALLKRASDGGAHKADIAKMREIVEGVTGRQKSGVPAGVARAANVVHAYGSIALMPHAAWSSLSEPMAALAVTGRLRAPIQAFAAILGEVGGTADSKLRAEIANAVGILTNPLIFILHRTFRRRGAGRSGIRRTSRPAAAAGVPAWLG